MKFDDTYVSRRHRYWLGKESDSGRHYASIPMINSKIDYVEHYWITPAQFEQFSDHQNLAINFVEECRSRVHDDLLVYRPGSDRGIPV